MTTDSSRRIQLLVVDDHTLFRRGLKALLSQDERFEEAREAADVGEALRSLAQARPDVILLDNHLPGVRGVEAIPSLKEAAPDCRILMLTVSENEEDLAAALQAGADGYLLKTVESDQLCDAIVKVLDGKSVVSPEMMTKLFNVFRSQGAPAPASAAPLTSTTAAPVVPEAPVPAPAAPPAEDADALAKLSARERQILALIARGDSNKLIARELDIAETTVKIHVQHILRKLNLTSRVQAAVLAVHHNLRT
ncbi:MAG: response regulator [Hydrogenophaga sp.]|jgi:two-component system nitrate/nitrite response regulator NarL|nr:response regulator [Hydrogenophaga sp.]